MARTECSGQEWSDQLGQLADSVDCLPVRLAGRTPKQSEKPFCLSSFTVEPRQLASLLPAFPFQEFPPLVRSSYAE